MLNPFYWYSIIWGVVYSLYNLGWSDLNIPLDPKLSKFFIITIIISTFLGFVFRRQFRYKRLRNEVKRNSSLSIFIIISCITEFVYARQIPLFSISLGLNSYGEFQGIPILHSIIVNTIIFYSSYLFYLYLETKSSKILFETILLVSMLLLMFHKGTTIICLFIIINLLLAKKRQDTKKNRLFKILIIILFAVLAIYFNGILSNIRSGYAWNDNSLIMRLGGIKGKWPSFIPKEIAWTYIYITSSLANLNTTFSYYINSFSFSRLFITIFPIFISKRMFINLLINPETDLILKNTVLNSVTGFAESTVTGGIIGIWCFYIYLMSLIIFISFYIKKYLSKMSTPYYAILSMQIVFLFFYNTLSTSATSFLILYMIILPLRNKINIKWKWRI